VIRVRVKQGQKEGEQDQRHPKERPSFHVRPTQLVFGSLPPRHP
jgi:hypothetical protein